MAGRHAGIDQHRQVTGADHVAKCRGELAELAQAEQSEVVAAAYIGANLRFGPEYLIPKPFDPRLMMKIAPAVAQAAAQGAQRVDVVPLFDDDRVLLERQFRYPHGRVMIELPAGKLEPGEPHLHLYGKREARSGRKMGHVTRVGHALP